MRTKQCTRCCKSFEPQGDEAFCNACHKEVLAGRYFEPMSNERPPANPRKGAVLGDVDGIRVYDYDPKYRGRRRGRQPQRHDA